MNRNKRQIRNWLMFFMLALLVSGITAIPVERELSWIIQAFPFEGSIKNWFRRVLLAVQHTHNDYPFIFYGYDWLAFAHFMLAILFIGPYIDPVRNKWVIRFGIIASIMVIPFALIAGYLRGLPAWWRIVDCLFGITGMVPFFLCLHKIKKMEKEEKDEKELKDTLHYSFITQ